MILWQLDNSTFFYLQVKKGPNGKDYEYEYVYYYYDEEEEGKPSASTNIQHEGISRTTSSPRRSSATNNRSKYSNVERSTTVEPATNEVIPNRNGNRGRQLGEGEDVSEERLPTNTRFPPRSLLVISIILPLLSATCKFFIPIKTEGHIFFNQQIQIES